MARSTLRRYEKIDYSDYSANPPTPSCPQNRMSHHDTSVFVANIPYPFGTERLNGYGLDDVPHDDPNWPTACRTCGYRFKDDDNWQHNVDRLYSGAPDGKLYTNREMPPGAMFDATWWRKKGPDGIALCVVLPPNGGDDNWIVESESSNGGGWTRTGTVPLVTVSPSIMTSRYHGFLTGGFLISC